MTETSFQENGRPISFDEAVTSGLSVGVPGTPMTWQEALDRWGTRSLRTVLAGARRLAANGFKVDQTFYDQTLANQARFNAFTSTRELFLPNGAPPPVGSVFKNPDLARTYDGFMQKGFGWAYDGRLASEIAHTAAHPPVAPDNTRRVRPGLMTSYDLAAYFAPARRPTHIKYRGYDVYGMAPPSSGGSTVGEALNILENVDLGSMTRTQALHYYLEASALAFADRGRYVGDPAYSDVPLAQLLSDRFAKERYCRINPAAAAAKPVAAGSPEGSYDTNCDGTVDTLAKDQEGPSTTHLTVADKWGNVVAYTLTIEATGGSGIVVPDRGFLLNNELTDFNFAGSSATDPNLPAPNKRPRSSMSPTIVLKDGKPFLALGSPGGSTIITTVLQMLINRVDFGMSLPAALAAPRATPRNFASPVQTEALFDRTELAGLGHVFADVPAPGEIGAATAIEFLPRNRFRAAAEPTRRGGGSAGVVVPTR
jgi:gamma-glutamyltranspeptidase/glutathione hydrolase